MSGFDGNTIHVVPVHPQAAADQRRVQSGNLSLTGIRELMHDFLMGFRLGGNFVYRDKLRANVLMKEYALEVNLTHLTIFNEEVASAVQEKPGDVMPLFERVATVCAQQILNPRSAVNQATLTENPTEEAEASGENASSSDIPPIQVTISTALNMLNLRQLTSDSINKLVRTPGIIIQTSTLSARATKLHLQCRSCRSMKVVYPMAGLDGMSGTGTGKTLPRVCDAPAPEGQKKNCPLDPYQIIHDKCTFVDSQTMKLQDPPDLVPTGELPRHLIMFGDRYLTSRVSPGTRVIATGIYSTFNPGKNRGNSGAVAVRQPYLRLLHLELDTSGTSSASPGSSAFGSRFSPEEEEEFSQMARSEGWYERFSNSVAPSIYGTADIKKAIACLLFGGSRKVLPDGMRLRGDINVLLLGDPGTAKSQLLKFVEKVAPIAVYTSGKGSSAAGLTASVQRDPVSREFYLEGGAMVLADGGVVCIDEFDKMRDEDRVAIHEAMEQQTISIAKAGITTILNSRTSVLAAANPVFGRYDDARSAGENIDFQTTILSRFDMIFIVKDTHDEARDKRIAKFILDIHRNERSAVDQEEAQGEIDIDKMKRFISYAKSKCAPRLTPDAAQTLSSHFVSLRKDVQQLERDNEERSSIPITVRQLEAIVRISESLAKIVLSPTVQEHHVTEAMRLFKTSTMDAVQASGVEGVSRGTMNEAMQKIEADVRRRLPIGWTTSYQALVKEFVTGQGFEQHALERVLYVLEKREVIRFSNGKKVVHRIGV